ncbi:MAG: TetR/AcrR family transcriptional regulator [Hominenteromicrobium sp.]
MPTDMKDLIAETFLAAAREKNVDKITVKDLVTACGISRQTFYYHFQDITDVIEWSVRRETQRALERTLAENDPQKAVHIFVSNIADNLGIIRRLLHSQRREQMENMLIHAFRSYLEALILHKAPGIRLTYTDFQLMLNFFTYGIVGLLLESEKNGTFDAEQATRDICRLISGRPSLLPQEQA